MYKRQDEIKSVVKAESVEGTLDKYTLGKNLTLADTEYKYSKNIAFSFGSETSICLLYTSSFTIKAAINLCRSDGFAAFLIFPLHTETSNCIA